MVVGLWLPCEPSCSFHGQGTVSLRCYVDNLRVSGWVCHFVRVPPLHSLTTCRTASLHCYSECAIGAFDKGLVPYALFELLQCGRSLLSWVGWCVVRTLTSIPEEPLDRCVSSLCCHGLDSHLAGSIKIQYIGSIGVVPHGIEQKRLGVFFAEFCRQAEGWLEAI